MCGLVGFLENRPFRNLEKVNTVIGAMNDAVAHRGPDANATWLDANKGIAFGHRRLAVVDLSEGGLQPMQSADGRYVLVFNGEIYNHLTLRRQIETETDTDARPWRGHSDTEVLLEAISHWGLHAALTRAYGMFALALWDRQTDTLSLARDRMGEKPLYYAQTAEGWVFSSELKGLLQSPDFAPVLDRAAIAAFLSYSYVPESECIFRGVAKVPPGGIVRLSAGVEVAERHTFEAFDDIVQSSIRRKTTAEPFAFEATAGQIEALLIDVIGEQMLSDVPLGCFLSGGIDSSLVASLMQSQTDTRIRTFSIGFDDVRFNEAPMAARVATLLNTDHTEFIVSEDDALEVVKDLPRIYDEPFADSSQIPTTLLCRLSRQSVTVALTGDGGDEVFGGYNRHVLGPRLLDHINTVPRLLRPPSAGLLRFAGQISSNERSAIRRIARELNLPLTAMDKLDRLADAVSGADSVEQLYDCFTRTFDKPESVLDHRPKSPSKSTAPPLAEGRLASQEWMMYMDSIGYLPGDVLVKVDRAAMSASLETRAPFLDARIVRAAWALPLDAKIKSKTGKRILRHILERHVPRNAIERPKQGFAIPVDRWLRGALRAWGETLLAREDLLAHANLNAVSIGRLWSTHQSGRTNNGQKLWTVLMLLSWLAEYESNLGNG